MHASLASALALVVTMSACHLASGISDLRYDASPDGTSSAVGGAGSDLRACETNLDCAGGACVDGSCCDRACDAGCEACRAELTGLPDGTCGPVLRGTDPEDACEAGGCVDAGLCCGESAEPAGGACPSACSLCSGGTCVFACDDAECRDQALTCPEGFACELRCGSKSSCDGTVLLCADRFACDVVCDATRKSCTGLTVRCGDGACGISGEEGTSDATTKLICGTNRCVADVAGSARPSVTCGASCDCEE